MNPIETLFQLAGYPTRIAMSILALAQVDLERRVAEEEYAKANPPQTQAPRRGRPPKPKDALRDYDEIRGCDANPPGNGDSAD